MHFSLKYIFLLISIANECVSKSINQDHLQLKFVFIVSTKHLYLKNDYQYYTVYDKDFYYSHCMYFLSSISTNSASS